MEPRLALDLIVFRIDRFVVDVSEIATQAPHLLQQAVLRVRHQFAIAPIP